jgi:phage gp36-like protein
MANEINNLDVSEVSPETVLADLIELVVMSHQNSVNTLKAFNALHQAACDLDVRFDERYATYLGTENQVVRELIQIPAEHVAKLVEAARVLRSNPSQGKTA